MTKAPELMISPMIDMMFLMLVFFIYCTMNMSEIKTIDIKLPIAQNASIKTKTNFKNNANNTLGKAKQEIIRLVKTYYPSVQDAAILSYIEMNKVSGDEFKLARQKGAFKDVDLIQSRFTGNSLIFRF